MICIDKKNFDQEKYSFEFLKRLVCVLDQMDTMVGLLDTSGRLLFANQVALQEVGATFREMQGIEFRVSPWRQHSLKAKKETDKMIARALSGQTALLEDYFVKRNGCLVPMIFSITPLRDRTGKIIGLIPEGKLIVDQKKIQDKITREQWETQQWINSMGAYVAKCDKNGRIISSNQPFLESMEVSMLELKNTYICDTTRFTCSAKTQKRLQYAIKEAGLGNKSTIEVTLAIGKEGAKPFLFSISPIVDSNGQISFLALEIRDISEQVRLRELMILKEKEYSAHLEEEISKVTKTLIQTEQFNERLVNSAPIGLIYLDEKGRLIFANSVMENKLEKFGVLKNSIKTKTLAEIGIFHADLAWKKQVCYALNQYLSGKIRMLLSRNGEDLLQFEVNAAPLKNSDGNRSGTILIMDDVTEQNRMEEELLRARIQSEKRSSIDLLVSGVAHELNNPLTSIIGCAEYLEEDPNISEESREAAQIIITDARRAGKIVSNLYNFCDKNRFDICPVDLNEVIRTVVEIRLHVVKKHGIKVILQLDPALHAIDSNMTEMQQVILNLLRNAVNVIKESGIGDTIYIRTFTDGESVVLEIEDNGPGIPADNLTKIFDPFFTTRQQGKGIGLGLSIVYGIIQKYEGRIYVDKTCLNGTRFVIRFPFSGSITDKEPDQPEYESWIPARVLVVDDEKNICMTLSKHLKSLGSKVDIALSGWEAFRKIEKNDYDLLLVDVKMPQMNGLKLYHKLRILYPELLTRFAFITGISRQEKNDLVNVLGIPVLQKPFTREDIIFFLNMFKSDSRCGWRNKKERTENK